MKEAAQLFGNDWNKFMDATTFVFNGIEWRRSATMRASRYRGEEEVFRGYFTEDYISPGDSGFRDDFRDNGNQIYHFWAGFATAFNPDPYPSAGGINANTISAHDSSMIVASTANFYHDYLFDRPWKGNGVSVRDYVLTVTAIDIASHTGPGKAVKASMELAIAIEFQLGTSGGSNGFVSNWSWAWITPFEKWQKDEK